ncbi:ABC-type amino acid transport/signal transduction systems, periplasmic component/domain [Hahella chejuensis KCTC 2396]|uniref:ABC-type amino acid transport/signal transduction systems, periplasmic component/domain n=1 Tax=Hahella chejuensis (strain KCTC 2396) TaxID=349521 RepID=Q2SF55_HAHCH|nr:transporter substrate-binding domain-containing protein [Hahella chejuensis]ABC30719.1 ABC-type amino acid transport/signal transduction systems, periplasmic component/domain [Hahella chejuensis KCTC 2396]
MAKALLLLIALAALLGGKVAAAADLVELKAAADPWPPFIDPEHPHGGVSVEIANAAFATQGYKVKQLIVPWARAVEGTRRGTFDLILDAWWSQERIDLFAYSNPYLTNEVKFIKLKGDLFEFKGLESLRGRVIGVVRGYAYNDAFMEADYFTRLEVTQFMQSVLMLSQRRINLTLEDELVARYRIQREEPALLPMLEFVEPPLSANKLYVISGMKNPRHRQYIDAFNRGLAIIKENGEFDRILKENGLVDGEHVQEGP